MLETANERIAVRVSGALDSVGALENVSLRAGDRHLRLRDIATVSSRLRRSAERPSSATTASPPSASASPCARAATFCDMGEQLNEEMARIGRDLPAGIDVHLVANQPDVVEESVGEFTSALFEAIVIVLLVSFVSLGARAGMVVAICIPLVLAITFACMQVFHIDLQRISLGALVIALGLLVDDAMIAVEMMVTKLEQGFDRFRAATFAYTSTAFPMLTGTLVCVAGFLPVGFAKSGAGEYCFTLFAVVTIALLTSWIVAVIFTPFVGAGLLKERRSAHGGGGHGTEGKLARAFRAVLLAALERRKLVIAGTAAAFVAAVIAFGFVEQQFFPASSRPELLVDLRLAQNASIQATDGRGRALREGAGGRPGHRPLLLLRRLRRRALLPAVERAAAERELRAGRGRHPQLRGARRGARAPRARAGGGLRHADGARAAARARTAGRMATAVPGAGPGRRRRAPRRRAGRAATFATTRTRGS